MWLILSRGSRLIGLLVLLVFLSGRFATASEADALAISRNILARHLPFGTILDPIFTSSTSDEILTYTRCGDSAIWTGHYLAAEAFRYKVTASPDALANVKAAIAGLKSLADVTGTNLLARCIIPMSSPYAQTIISQETSNGIFKNNSAGYYWVGNTSRDQYSGAMFGLAVAYDNVDDAGVRSSIKDLVTRLIDFLRGHAWTIVMPDGSISTTFIGRADQQLSFLQVGRHVNSDHFSTIYDVDHLLLAAAVVAPVALEVTSNDSYFKFNLDYINFYNLIRLDSGVLKSVYQDGYSLLRKHTDDHQNAFFNMIDHGLNGPNSVHDPETVALLDAWLQRSRRDQFVDLRGKLPSCNNPDEACNPVPVALRAPTDFLWQRSPFQLDGGGTGTIETAGIDYILPYWMARVYGVIGANSVVSAASGSSTVSPESIVSLYGSNLASSTMGATAVPLPTTLGGIGVQVQDSAGTSRPAPLFYASPTQINFEIPAGTAAGLATVKVADASGATTATASANVQNVAPALFTADASGKGVAAAFAIHVSIPGNQQSSTPVFQCTNSVCTSTPISLGIDTPTYLSLYGTGIRNRSSLDKVSVTIKGVSAPVTFAGSQGGFAGLDQVNVAVPLNLRGSGESNLVLTVDGQTANTVTVNIQ